MFRRSQRLISVMAYKSGKSAHCFALMKSFSIAVLAKRSRFIYDEASSIPEEPKSSVFSLSSSTPTTPSTWTKQEYYSRTLDFSCELLRLLGEGMREQRVSMDESASGPNGKLFFLFSTFRFFLLLSIWVRALRILHRCFEFVSC